MIKTSITDKNILDREPMLSEFLFDSELDYSTKISDAYTQMVLDLRHLKGYNLRLIGTPLPIDTDEDQSIVFDGTISEEDRINRSVFLVSITSHTDEQAFQLQGTDDGGDNYVDIGDEVIIDDIGEYTMDFFDMYKKYRVQKTTAGACVYSTSLIESVFQTLQLYKVLYLIYQSLQRVLDDEWYEKKNEYNDLYIKLLDTAQIFVDVDDDGKIDDDESEQNTSIINIG